MDEEWFTSERDKTEIDQSGNLNNVATLKINDNGNESVVMIRDSDGESAFTSISYPNEVVILDSEQELEPEPQLEAEAEAVSDYDDENMSASMQTTIKDSSSVNGSIPSIQPALNRVNSQIGIKKANSYTIIGRIRNIFHHG